MRVFSRPGHLLLTILIVLGIAVAGFSWLSRGNELADVHARIQVDFPAVEHISAADFAEFTEQDVVVFDVREPEEFDVSHIEGAILLPPETPVEHFLAEHGSRVAGKRVIFYCSVGVRSSQYAEQAQSRLRELGAAQVVNLEHGLFGWHNEARALISYSSSSTDLIHPYDQFWGRLLNRRDLISTGNN